MARAYLVDEEGSNEASALLDDPHLVPVTGTWTRVEVSGALARAARAGRADTAGLLALLDADLGTGGNITVLAAPQERVEQDALALVRTHAIRATDAWHLATARIVVPPLARTNERIGFASRDAEQAEIARALGFEVV